MYYCVQTVGQESTEDLGIGKQAKVRKRTKIDMQYSFVFEHTIVGKHYRAADGGQPAVIRVIKLC
jgi:hypothetical protein